MATCEDVKNGEMNGMKAEFITDDKDLYHKATMVVSHSPNGDWYQCIKWKDRKGLNCASPSVRFCTSGGASTSHPGLTGAVAGQYHAINGVTPKVDIEFKEELNSLLSKIGDDERFQDDIGYFKLKFFSELKLLEG